MVLLHQQKRKKRRERQRDRERERETERDRDRQTDRQTGGGEGDEEEEEEEEEDKEEEEDEDKEKKMKKKICTNTVASTNADKEHKTPESTKHTSCAMYLLPVEGEKATTATINGFRVQSTTFLFFSSFSKMVTSQNTEYADKKF